MAIRQDDQIRVLVVTGFGSSFSAGPFPPPGLLDGRLSPAELQAVMRGLRPAQAVAEVEKPVIAMLNGPAAGLGAELALACDLRYAAPRASFQFPHVLHGLLPWDGGTQRLPRLVGLPRATELLLTGRKLTARQALAWGLVHQVLPAEHLGPAVDALAAQLVSGAPIAARYAKEAVLHGADLPLENALRLEADLSVLLQSTADRAEGLASFREKRRPAYKGV
jgi:enoyl-CoA hydratase/carnithine racemase